ncbi:MAG: hypothetical protein K8E24_014520, partial [Methanobacterium paludis]|nr:hypothetical protein [Methanobacterium paludis]
MVVENSNLTKKQVYKEYLNNKDLNELEDLEMVLRSLIKTTTDQKSKIGLEIILILISHKRKDVKASALGNLYMLARDKSLQNIAIKELKTLLCDENYHVRKSAQNSLEVYANEANTLEITEIILELSNGLRNNVQNLKKNITTIAKRFKSLNITSTSKLFLNSFSKLFSKIPIYEPEIKLKNRMTYYYNIL